MGNNIYNVVFENKQGNNYCVELEANGKYEAVQSAVSHLKEQLGKDFNKHEFYPIDIKRGKHITVTLGDGNERTDGSIPSK